MSPRLPCLVISLADRRTAEQRAPLVDRLAEIAKHDRRRRRRLRLLNLATFLFWTAALATTVVFGLRLFGRH